MAVSAPVALVDASGGGASGGARVLGDYTLMDKLGSGLQGKVYKARCGTDGRLYAVKLIDQDAVRASAKVFTNLQREIAAMERVAGHPHVVGVKQVAYDVMKPRKKRPGQFRRCIMIVMELESGGELFDYLMLSKFPETIARSYFSQLLEALHYAHSKEVAHRDIKPENLLLDDHFALRVADWGLSAVLDDLSSAYLRTQCGTHAYMAPEVLRREAYRGASADVWSAGVVLFIMIAGFPPFEKAAPGDWWFDRISHNQHALFWTAHERSATFSPGAKDLINAIFVSDPRTRITVEDALKHPWLASPASAEELYAEMRRRRLQILTNKGLPPPPDDAGGDDEDMGGDPFARDVTRGADDESALPARNPTLLAGRGAAKPAGAAGADAAAALSGGLPTRLAVPDDAVAEPLPHDATAKAQWFAINAEVSPAAVARSLAYYFESTRPAELSLRGGKDSLKVRAAVPLKGGTALKLDLRVYRVDAGAAAAAGVPADATYVVAMQRAAGEALAANAVFGGLQRAYTSVLAGSDDGERGAAAAAAGGAGAVGGVGDVKPAAVAGAAPSAVSLEDTVSDTPTLL